MRSDAAKILRAAAAAAFLVSACGRDFNNPADPANNGGFYGGIDKAIAGTWDEIMYNVNNVPSVWSRALICGADSFVFEGTDYRLYGRVNAHQGQVFCYYANATAPDYFFDYSLNRTGDTLYLNQDASGMYTDPRTIHGARVLFRSP